MPKVPEKVVKKVYNYMRYECCGLVVCFIKGIITSSLALEKSSHHSKDPKQDCGGCGSLVDRARAGSGGR